MSYHLATTTSRDDAPGALDVAIQDHFETTNHGDAEPAAREHLAAARDFIEDLLDVVGRPDDQVTVTISGHANKDHAPQEGYGDESVNVSIQVTPAERAPEG